MNQCHQSPPPVNQYERINLLDSLRGMAVPGIMLVNITVFGLPESAQGDPSVFNELDSANFRIWYIINWIFAGAPRAIFSMLFGAGILLLFQRIDKSGSRDGGYFFRRQLWLILFALINVFLFLWPGDILLNYSILGMLMFTFRKLSSQKLIIAALACLLFMTLRDNQRLYLDKQRLFEGLRVASIDTSIQKLTPDQQYKVELMQAIVARGDHSNKLRSALETSNTMQGSYFEVFNHRTSSYLENIWKYLFEGLWDILLFMFLGMAFFRLRILQGLASTYTYAWMCVIGLVAGLLLSYRLLQSNIDSNFNYSDYIRKTWFDYQQLARALRSIGLFAFIMLLYRSGVFGWLFRLFRPVGQMALSNYLLQSLICGIIFYGPGLGLYGKLERQDIYYIAGLILCLQIAMSHIWLRFFLFGPFEWIWRCLIYWKWLPLRPQA